MGEIEQKDIPAGNAEVATQEQQQDSGDSGEQAQTQEQTSEFWLDENGELQGDFSDWGTETGEEQKKPEEEEGQKQEEKQEEQGIQYYTPEELASLELHQIDPNRLPDELKPYYQAMLRQAVAQQKEQPLASPQIDEKAMLEAIKQEAKQRVEQKLGEQFDEMNPDHMVALSIESARLTQQYERKLQAQQKIAELRMQEPYFQQIDRYAQEKILQLPAKDYLKLTQAIDAGDINAVVKFWEQCRKEFYEQKLGIKQQNQKPSPKPAPQPPKVEGAGKGGVNVQPKIKPQDFANMSEDEQIEALIKMGLVEI